MEIDKLKEEIKEIKSGILFYEDYQRLVKIRRLIEICELLIDELSKDQSNSVSEIINKT